MYFLSNTFVQILVGFLTIVFIPTLFFWQYSFGTYFILTDIVVSTIAGLCLLICVLFTLRNFYRFPGIISSVYILPVILFWSALIVLVIKLTSVPYSFYYILMVSFLLLIYCFILHIIRRHLEHYRFAYIPVGRAIDMPDQVPEVEWVKMSEPQLDAQVSAIVTDLHSFDLTDEWQRFIADQTLQGMPVYHYRNIRESLTGRVRIRHIYENELGSLLPSPSYTAFKYCFDVFFILLSLPIVLPIFLIVMLLIKLDDGGSIFYVQPRIGHRGKIIQVIKFRSMKELSDEVVTTTNDERITRVGRFIRKIRIDELPQFYNVIKGEMSLIGPRAEFLNFARDLEKTVPFFNYRHIVKPGISGWAQVNQGYATGTEETKIKIEYDFFYIKHFSFSLDLLIFFKTIQTMLTGFGAR
ncbi:sugar transferase [Cardiobacteriaceae bacterium TAE3-ERU3]|nr:sugar transferase [Cardiobacteriaceae bacterium TAE3-ERU3]